MNTEKSAYMPILSSDWHPADVKAALEKRGWTLSQLSLANGYTRTAAARVLHTPWPKMERIVAKAIHQTPQNIWPSRYDAKGESNRKRGPKKVQDQNKLGSN